MLNLLRNSALKLPTLISMRATGMPDNLKTCSLRPAFFNRNGPRSV
jgi:hypothetical protein